MNITFTAPFVLFKHGIAKGKNVTSYPSVKSDIEGFYNYKEISTVVDGKFYILDIHYYINLIIVLCIIYILNTTKLNLEILPAMGLLHGYQLIG